MEKQLTLGTFVVRLWREPSAGDWRGQIVHLPSHETHYFSNFAQLEAVLRQYAPGFSLEQEQSHES